MSIQGGDTTKYRSRQYVNTRWRYNKVPEPPICQYKAEIQQSTGAANMSIQGGDTTKYRSRQDNNTRLSCKYTTIILRLAFTENTSSRRNIDCTKPRLRFTKNTISRYSYNYTVLSPQHRGRDTPRVPTADTVTDTLYCYNNTGAEVQHKYQQPTQLQIHCTATNTAIPGRDTTTLPAAKHSHR